MAQDDWHRITLRLPADLHERIAKSAGVTSINALIVKALEEKYPPETIDLRTMSGFLASLAGVSAPDGDKEYLAELNHKLSTVEHPWTIEAGWDGAVTFYPYATPDPTKAAETKPRRPMPATPKGRWLPRAKPK